MSQREDFTIGAFVGGLVWLLYIGSGAVLPNTPSPIDSALRVIYPDVALVKSLIVYVLAGGVLGILISNLKEKVIR